MARIYFARRVRRACGELMQIGTTMPAASGRRRARLFEQTAKSTVTYFIEREIKTARRQHRIGILCMDGYTRTAYTIHYRFSHVRMFGLRRRRRSSRALNALYIKSARANMEHLRTLPLANILGPQLRLALPARWTQKTLTSRYLDRELQPCHEFSLREPNAES